MHSLILNFSKFNYLIRNYPTVNYILQAPFTTKHNVLRSASQTINVASTVENNEIKFEPKSVEIYTCGDLYRSLKTTNKYYKNAPSDDILLSVDYLDLKHSHSDKNQPVVLFLHGSPGSYQDFRPLIKHLYPKGVRIIAPNFPVYSVLHQTKCFRHSTDEKSAYLIDFLDKIGVKNIDMLVSHSSAVYPGLRLCVNENGPKVKSFVFLNPGSHRRSKAMKPHWIIDNIVKLNLNPTIHEAFMRFGVWVFKLQNTIRVERADHVLLAATTMYFANIKKMSDYLNKLKEIKLPVLLLFSLNDGLIKSSHYFEMAEMLGAQDHHFTKFDKEVKCLQEASPTELLEVIQFEHGGHYAFLKYAPIVNSKIEQFLRKVTQRVD